MKEFNISQGEIPATMREFIDLDNANFIDRNIKVVKRFNDINKIVYLSKIKYNLENQVQSSKRAQDIYETKQQQLQMKISKWEDFRVRRDVILGKYMKVKRKQRSVESVMKHIFLIQAIKICFA